MKWIENQNFRHCFHLREENPFGHGGLWSISDLVATLGRLKASNPHALTIPRRSACSREDRHHLHVPTAAFGANEPPMLRHVNEDHVVPELQFLERLYRLMMAAGAQAMDCQCLFARCSGMSNGPGGLATCHARRRSLTLIWLVCAPSSIDKHRQFRVRKHLQRLTSQDHRGQASAAVRRHRYKIAGFSSSSIDDRLIDVFVPYRQCIAGNTKHLSPICGCREISSRVFRRVPLVLSTRALKLLRVKRKNVEWLQDTK